MVWYQNANLGRLLQILGVQFYHLSLYSNPSECKIDLGSLFSNSGGFKWVKIVKEKNLGELQGLYFNILQLYNPIKKIRIGLIFNKIYHIDYVLLHITCFSVFKMRGIKCFRWQNLLGGAKLSWGAQIEQSQEAQFQWVEFWGPEGRSAAKYCNMCLIKII